jgi:hypothetical protein
MDTQLLGKEERKDKIRKFVADLSKKFNEHLFDNQEKLILLKKLKPTVEEEFWQRMDKLDALCLDYLKGDIPWDGDEIGMDVLPTGVLYPTLEIQMTPQNYGRDLFCWLVLQTKDL